MSRSLSVGTRWALLYTLVTSVALSIPIGFVYLSVKRQVEKDALLLLQSYLAEVRSEMEAQPDRADGAVRAFTERLRRLTPELDYGAAFSQPDGSGFRVGSLEGRGLPLPGAGQEAAPYRVQPLEEGAPYFVVATSSFRGGVLQAALSSRRFAGEVARIRRLLVVSAPLVLGLSALCGAWLARRSLRPIARMTDSARRIGGENLSERIPLRGTNDELDQLAATLNGMFDRVGEAMERLRGFSADAAHQLNSPITSLRTEIEVMLGDRELDEATRSLLESILAQVCELGGSVSAMLRLARQEAGLSEEQAVHVELAPLLHGVASLFQPMAEERGITLELLAEEPIGIRGDVAWLRELFANLVQNAIAHTPRGGHVSISLVSKPDAIEVRVVDDGEGIPQAEQKRVFDRFYRVSPARGLSGSGLGLALARQIAIAHGGGIELESEPGRGSTFTVRLPHPRVVPGTRGKVHRNRRTKSGCGGYAQSAPSDLATCRAEVTASSWRPTPKWLPQ